MARRSATSKRLFHARSISAVGIARAAGVQQTVTFREGTVYRAWSDAKQRWSPHVTILRRREAMRVTARDSPAVTTLFTVRRGEGRVAIDAQKIFCNL